MKKIAAMVQKTSSKKSSNTQSVTQNHLMVMGAALVIALIDTLFFKESSDVVLFGVIIAYAILAYLFHIRSKLTFIICLILLVIMFIGYLFSGPSVLTEKAAVWLYLFMALGIFQQWKE